MRPAGADALRAELRADDDLVLARPVYYLTLVCAMSSGLTLVQFVIAGDPTPQQWSWLGFTAGYSVAFSLAARGLTVRARDLCLVTAVAEILVLVFVVAARPQPYSIPAMLCVGSTLLGRRPRETLAIAGVFAAAYAVQVVAAGPALSTAYATLSLPPSAEYSVAGASLVTSFVMFEVVWGHVERYRRRAAALAERVGLEGEALAQAAGARADQNYLAGRHNRELAEVNAALTAARARHEASTGELRQLAYATAHDLKTPLRTAASFSQLLARRLGGAAPAAQREALAAVVAHAAEMTARLDVLGAHVESELEHAAR